MALIYMDLYTHTAISAWLMYCWNLEAAIHTPENLTPTYSDSSSKQEHTTEALAGSDHWTFTVLNDSADCSLVINIVCTLYSWDSLASYTLFKMWFELSFYQWEIDKNSKYTHTRTHKKVNNHTKGIFVYLSILVYIWVTKR